MKKNTATILISILIVLQILSLSRIGSMQNDLRNVKNQLDNLASYQSNQISNIYTNIDSMLKRQSSILDSYDYSFGTIDSDKLTVPVTFNITAKEVKSDTQAMLYVSGESIEMRKNGTTFAATIPADIFDALEAKVVLADGGIQRTEKLEVWENLREKVLPTVYIRFEGENSSGYSKNPGENTGEYQSKLSLRLDVKPVQNNTIEKARLVIEIDGKVISEKPFNSGGLLNNIDEKITLSAGKTLTMSVLATDSLGLVHKTVINKFMLDENADQINGDDWMWMDTVIIIGKDGKVLYAPQYDKVN